MRQTPAHEIHNADLLRFIPSAVSALIEVGCSSGALAREYKKLNPTSSYIGVEISSDYAALASRYCDRVLVQDIEEADEDFWVKFSDRECWIFGDTLEHLRSPWDVLRRIASIIPRGGCVVACIPNAQHWSVQARLNIGDFRYQDSGLLDRTHLRWFTRQTIFELFHDAGFKITDGMARVFDEPLREKYLPVIATMAGLSKADPEVAVKDATAFQYVIRAVRD